MPIGRVQREARGLLPFLDIVGTQERPAWLDEVVQGDIDMLPFYGANLLVGRSQDGNISAVGGAVTLSVPQGEAWLVLGVQYTLVVGAAGEQFLGVCTATVRNGQQIRIDKMSTIQTAVAANARLGGAFTIEHPFLLTAGMALNVIAEDLNVAAGRAANIGAMVYAFTI